MYGTVLSVLDVSFMQRKKLMLMTELLIGNSAWAARPVLLSLLPLDLTVHSY